VESYRGMDVSQIKVVSREESALPSRRPSENRWWKNDADRVAAHDSSESAPSEPMVKRLCGRVTE